LAPRRLPSGAHAVNTSSLLDSAGSGFGSFCSLICFYLGSIRIGCCSSVGGGASFGSGWNCCRLNRDDHRRLNWNNDRCCWLNRRHRHFFFLAASGQSKSGEQGGEQKGFFHDEFSRNGDERKAIFGGSSSAGLSQGLRCSGPVGQRLKSRPQAEPKSYPEKSIRISPHAFFFFVQVSS